MDGDELSLDGMRSKSIMLHQTDNLFNSLPGEQLMDGDELSLDGMRSKSIILHQTNNLLHIQKALHEVHDILLTYCQELRVD